jgi:hypothetical protein
VIERERLADEARRHAAAAKGAKRGKAEMIGPPNPYRAHWR